MRNTNVLIIGGGPAGLSCAFHLSKKGYEATVIEKNFYPFRKVCGEVCSPKALKELESIGFPFEEFHVLKEIEVFAGKHHMRFSLEGNECRMIPRDILSERMVNITRKNGVNVIEGENVSSLRKNGKGWIVITNKNEYNAEVVVGADGYSSIVRRKIFRFSPRGKDIAIGVRGIYRDKHKGTLQFYILESLMPGYAWKFPLNKDTVNVGIGIRADVMRKKGIAPVKVLENLKKEIDILSEGAEELIPPQPYPIYLGSHIGETVGNNVLLIGESAGFVNPFTGEGIFYALRSGKICAEVLSLYFSSRKNLYNYDTMWRKDFGFGLVLSKVYQRMVTKSRIEKVMRFSYKNKDVRNTIFESLLGVPVLRIPVYLKILFRR